MSGFGLPDASIPVYQICMTFTPNSNGIVGSRATIAAASSGGDRKFRWKRLVTTFVLAAGFCFVAGFMFFLSEIDSYAETAPANVSAQGIAVLTGGFARLLPAVELLKMERGERLLLSGVNPQNSDGSLKSALNIDDELFDCCVDVDLDAMDTIGNAVGISHWAKSKNYNKIIIVTNDYHMPRSILEVGRQMSGVELVPFVVRNQPNADESFGTKLDRYRVLSGEYVKYVATNARRLFDRSGSTSNAVSAGLSTGW